MSAAAREQVGRHRHHVDMGAWSRRVGKNVPVRQHGPSAWVCTFLFVWLPFIMMTVGYHRWL